MPAKINRFTYEETHANKVKESVHVAATVKVKEFDKEKMTVDVQPLSKSLQNGTYESQPQILAVPVAVTRIGGYIYRPWIKKDDVGVVIYLDHDTDATVAKGDEAEPLTERNHAATDAIFIGGIVSGNYKVKDLPDEAQVLAKEDGSIYLAIEKDQVHIKGDVFIEGEVHITKDELVDGKITAKGDVIAENRVSGAHHTHPGDSGGTTGEPN